jgi:NADP-dependent 3-hydroxy acid dehydrogenase YdfG
MKTAIVTGANRGVGYAISSLLFNNGWNVLAASKTKPNFNHINDNNFISNFQLDVTDFKAIENFYDNNKDFTIDLIVHNAGGGSNPKLIELENPEDFQKAYALNVSGPMYLSKLFIKNMEKSQSPTIIFITSLGGKYPYVGGGNYINAKRGEMALIDTMRLEYPYHGIKITEICPGTIDTQLEHKENAITAEDMAETVLWVANLPSHLNINHIELNHINSRKY